ncbi:unnamed protein product [Amoebophrya sp. A120]|nr:unnamed protein product [Amoebophrya sp. A120]|eukprot:GSA120T00022324001.1
MKKNKGEANKSSQQRGPPSILEQLYQKIERRSGCSDVLHVARRSSLNGVVGRCEPTSKRPGLAKIGRQGLALVDGRKNSGSSSNVTHCPPRSRGNVMPSIISEDDDLIDLTGGSFFAESEKLEGNQNENQESSDDEGETEEEDAELYTGALWSDLTKSDNQQVRQTNDAYYNDEDPSSTLYERFLQEFAAASGAVQQLNTEDEDENTNKKQRKEQLRELQKRMQQLEQPESEDSLDTNTDSSSESETSGDEESDDGLHLKVINLAKDTSFIDERQFSASRSKLTPLANARAPGLLFNASKAPAPQLQMNRNGKINTANSRRSPYMQQQYLLWLKKQSEMTQTINNRAEYAYQQELRKLRGDGDSASAAKFDKNFEAMLKEQKNAARLFPTGAEGKTKNCAGDKELQKLREEVEYERFLQQEQEILTAEQMRKEQMMKDDQPDFSKKIPKNEIYELLQQGIKLPPELMVREEIVEGLDDHGTSRRKSAKKRTSSSKVLAPHQQDEGRESSHVGDHFLPQDTTTTQISPEERLRIAFSDLEKILKRGNGADENENESGERTSYQLFPTSPNSEGDTREAVDLDEEGEDDGMKSRMFPRSLRGPKRSFFSAVCHPALLSSSVNKFKPRVFTAWLARLQVLSKRKNRDACLRVEKALPRFVRGGTFWKTTTKMLKTTSSKVSNEYTSCASRKGVKFVNNHFKHHYHAVKTNSRIRLLFRNQVLPLHYGRLRFPKRFEYWQFGQNRDTSFSSESQLSYYYPDFCYDDENWRLFKRHEFLKQRAELDMLRQLQKAIRNIAEGTDDSVVLGGGRLDELGTDSDDEEVDFPCSSSSDDDDLGVASRKKLSTGNRRQPTKMFDASGRPQLAILGRRDTAGRDVYSQGANTMGEKKCNSEQQDATTQHYTHFRKPTPDSAAISFEWQQNEQHPLDKVGTIITRADGAVLVVSNIEYVELAGCGLRRKIDMVKVATVVAERIEEEEEEVEKIIENASSSTEENNGKEKNSGPHRGHDYAPRAGEDAAQDQGDQEGDVLVLDTMNTKTEEGLTATGLRATAAPSGTSKNTKDVLKVDDDNDDRQEIDERRRPMYRYKLHTRRPVLLAELAEWEKAISVEMLQKVTAWQGGSYRRLGNKESQKFAARKRTDEDEMIATSSTSTTCEENEDDGNPVLADFDDTDEGDARFRDFFAVEEFESLTFDEELENDTKQDLYAEPGEGQLQDEDRAPTNDGPLQSKPGPTGGDKHEITVETRLVVATTGTSPVDKHGQEEDGEDVVCESAAGGPPLFENRKQENDILVLRVPCHGCGGVPCTRQWAVDEDDDQIFTVYQDGHDYDWGSPPEMKGDADHARDHYYPDHVANHDFPSRHVWNLCTSITLTNLDTHSKDLLDSPHAILRTFVPLTDFSATASGFNSFSPSGRNAKNVRKVFESEIKRQEKIQLAAARENKAAAMRENNNRVEDLQAGINTEVDTPEETTRVPDFHPDNPAPDLDQPNLKSVVATLRADFSHVQKYGCSIQDRKNLENQRRKFEEKYEQNELWKLCFLKGFEYRLRPATPYNPYNWDNYSAKDVSDLMLFSSSQQLCASGAGAPSGTHGDALSVMAQENSSSGAGCSSATGLSSSHTPSIVDMSMMNSSTTTSSLFGFGLLPARTFTPGAKMKTATMTTIFIPRAWRQFGHPKQLYHSDNLLRHRRVLLQQEGGGPHNSTHEGPPQHQHQLQKSLLALQNSTACASSMQPNAHRRTLDRLTGFDEERASDRRQEGWSRKCLTDIDCEKSVQEFLAEIVGSVEREISGPVVEDEVGERGEPASANESTSASHEQHEGTIRAGGRGPARDELLHGDFISEDPEEVALAAASGGQGPRIFPQLQRTDSASSSSSADEEEVVVDRNRGGGLQLQQLSQERRDQHDEQNNNYSPEELEAKRRKETRRKLEKRFGVLFQSEEKLSLLQRAVAGLVREEQMRTQDEKKKELRSTVFEAISLESLEKWEEEYEKERLSEEQKFSSAALLHERMVEEVGDEEKIAFILKDPTKINVAPPPAAGGQQLYNYVNNNYSKTASSSMNKQQKHQFLFQKALETESHPANSVINDEIQKQLRVAEVRGEKKKDLQAELKQIAALMKQDGDMRRKLEKLNKTVAQRSNIAARKNKAKNNLYYGRNNNKSGYISNLAPIPEGSESENAASCEKLNKQDFYRDHGDVVSDDDDSLFHEQQIASLNSDKYLSQEAEKIARKRQKLQTELQNRKSKARALCQECGIPVENLLLEEAGEERKRVGKGLTSGTGPQGTTIVSTSSTAPASRASLFAAIDDLRKTKQDLYDYGATNLELLLHKKTSPQFLNSPACARVATTVAEKVEQAVLETGENLAALTGGTQVVTTTMSPEMYFQQEFFGNDNEAD